MLSARHLRKNKDWEKKKKNDTRLKDIPVEFRAGILWPSHYKAKRCSLVARTQGQYDRWGISSSLLTCRGWNLHHDSHERSFVFVDSGWTWPSSGVDYQKTSWEGSPVYEISYLCTLSQAPETTWCINTSGCGKTWKHPKRTIFNLGIYPDHPPTHFRHPSLPPLWCLLLFSRSLCRSRASSLGWQSFEIPALA